MKIRAATEGAHKTQLGTPLGNKYHNSPKNAHNNSQHNDGDNTNNSHNQLNNNNETSERIASYRRKILKFKNEHLTEFRAITLMNLSFLLDMSDGILSELLETSAALHTTSLQPLPFHISNSSRSFNLNLALSYWLMRRTKDKSGF